MNCSYLFVPLTTSKVLSLDNSKQKQSFVLYCSHLFVPLQRICNRNGNQEDTTG